MGEAVLVIYALPLPKALGMNYVCLAQLGDRQRWWLTVSLLELETRVCDYFRLDWGAVEKTLIEEHIWRGLVPISYEDAVHIRLV